MIVLGLIAFIPNPAACILVDGKLVAFAEEERFVRMKGADGFFPARAIQFCLEEAKIRMGDVDRIAVGWDFSKYKFRIPLLLLRRWWRYITLAGGSVYEGLVKEIIGQQPSCIRHRIHIGLRGMGYKGDIPPIEFVSHHLAHAASTFYASGFEAATIVVIDGSGEERATSIYIGRNDDIVEVDHVDVPNSLGWFYAAFSSYIGFKPYEEDGFLMGLAPYGRAVPEIEDKMRKILSVSDRDYYRVQPQYTLLGGHSTNEFYSDQLIELLGPPRFKGEPITSTHENIAFMAQHLLEETVVDMIRKVIGRTGVRHLCLAGGVALNCKMNGVIRESGLADRIFVQPVSNDAGSALGAAMVISQAEGDDPRFVMSHAKWGPGYTEGYVKGVLDQAGVRYDKPESIEKKAAEAIASGKIVAWFDGRMEAGPRALGGRSILADASKQGMNDHVNERVKHRDRWRPFCPSFTEAAATKYYEGGDEARFMIVAYPVEESLKKDIPAVVHVDGTMRPQLVTEAYEPRYHRLIQLVGQMTGVEAVLNTSFNVKGEPIVCTPADALRCFYGTGMDALAIEGFWLEK